MKNDQNNKQKRSKNICEPQGAELDGLIKSFGRNREAGIAELRKMEEAVQRINLNKAAMSADKRAGFIFEEVVAGTFNSSARKAGDLKVTAITGSNGGFGVDPRVDIKVVRGDQVIAEAQAKCCASPARNAVEVAKSRYKGTERIVPAGQARPAQQMLLDSAKGKSASANPRMREIGAARQEAAGKVTEQLKAGGHKSKAISHKEAMEMAKGNTTKISNAIARETVATAAISAGKAGAVFSGGVSTLTSAYKVANGDMSLKEAAKTVAKETVVGGARGAATAVVAEGVKKVAGRTAVGSFVRGSGPLAVAGCVVDIATDAYKGELTVKSTAKSVTRAAGGWAGAEGGAAIGTMIFPGVGTIVGGILGGVCGSMLCGAW